MQDFFGSVRRSVVFRPSDDAGAGRGAEGGGIAGKIGSYLRKSRFGRAGLGFQHGLPSLPPPPEVTPPEVTQPEAPPPIRWRKGELIGAGAYGHVFMGMNLDSGELLAVKQVLIGTNNASKAKAQAHIRELEEEVNLLKKLSHPNIVRYLGTIREEETLNILLEFVPGGSISSLLGKFGSFTEPVIRKYTKQLLQGLEYLHQNGIIHRDIKGANILVDNKGFIKLADFGASKQVARLHKATVTAPKSLKGTPYWMAPEVIVQTGHSFTADIWSVGCTVIEMATGEPPWCRQYQEAAALYHIGTTKSHPPIPEHLSSEAKDFLLKCLQKEPSLRATASDLLLHPFVTCEFQGQHQFQRCSVVEDPSKNVQVLRTDVSTRPRATHRVSTCDNRESSATLFPANLSIGMPPWEMNDSEDMCKLYDEEDFPMVGSSFNSVSKPDCPSKFGRGRENMDAFQLIGSTNDATISEQREGNFASPCEMACDDVDEVTEPKIKAFLDELAFGLLQMQTQLYEEFYSINSHNVSSYGVTSNENMKSSSKHHPKCRVSPSRVMGAIQAVCRDKIQNRSPGNEVETERTLREIPLSRNTERGGRMQNLQREASCQKLNSSEKLERKWEKELHQELDIEREKRQAGGVGGKASPKDRALCRKRDLL